MTASATTRLGLDASRFEVRIARTAAELVAIVDLRARVFRDEQGIVSHELTDDDDETSVHVYVRCDREVIAMGRLSPPANGRADGQIAWVATVPEYRGRGAGSAVMDVLLSIADQHRFPAVLISAQTHALPFYRRFGFVPYGDQFVVKGIEHQYMERRRPRG
jgi:predicted GNAT family N-acyltransferase